MERESGMGMKGEMADESNSEKKRAREKVRELFVVDFCHPLL